MMYHVIPVAAIIFAAMAGTALADDHLVKAAEHGLNPDSQPFTVNPAGHGGDLAPGQGSPFVGYDQQTPATDTGAANDHAQIKPRG